MEASCGVGILLTILTLFAIGSAVVLFVFSIIFVEVYDLDEFEGVNLLTWIVVGLVISLIVFAFCLYASIKQVKWALSILGIIFCLFALVMLTIGISVLVFESTFTDYFENVFLNCNEVKNKPIIKSIQDAFECSYWVNVDVNCTINGSQPYVDCQEIFLDTYNKFKFIVFFVCLIIAILLGVGVFFAYKERCCNKKSNDEKSHQAFVTPLTYGW